MCWGLPSFKTSKNNEISTRILSLLNCRRELSVYDLSEESKRLLSMAFKNEALPKNIVATLSSNQDIRAPLHRFTPAKPLGATSLGLLKRNAEAGVGIIFNEENLFIPAKNSLLHRSPNLHYQ